jgi:hypothetical protein
MKQREKMGTGENHNRSENENENEERLCERDGGMDEEWGGIE